MKEFKLFNDTVAQYEKWLREKKNEVASLPPLAWGIDYLKEQKVTAEVRS